MSTAELDYSNTIIYKITCKDPNITDKYVGHTIDFVKRRYAHSNNAQSEKSPNYNLKLYKFIRDNGGWNNWKMEIVNFYNCNNLREAKEKEQEHYVELQATLNSIEPLKPKCDIKNEIPNDKKIQKSTNNLELANRTKFICEICNTGTDNKFDFNKHLSSRKHLDNNVANQIITKTHICKTCNSEYKHQSSLCKHSKICKQKQVKQSTDNPDFNHIINELLNQNKYFNNILIEQVIERKKETSETVSKLFDSAGFI